MKAKVAGIDYLAPGKIDVGAGTRFENSFVPGTTLSIGRLNSLSKDDRKELAGVKLTAQMAYRLYVKYQLPKIINNEFLYNKLKGMQYFHCDCKEVRWCHANALNQLFGKPLKT